MQHKKKRFSFVRVMPGKPGMDSVLGSVRREGHESFLHPVKFKKWHPFCSDIAVHKEMI